MTDILVENTYDEEGRLCGVLYGRNPFHRESWRDEFDCEGRKVAHIVSDNPKHQESWRIVYDNAGRVISETWADNPKSRQSCRKEYAEDGRLISYVIGETELVCGKEKTMTFSEFLAKLLADKIMQESLEVQRKFEEAKLHLMWVHEAAQKLREMKHETSYASEEVKQEK